jgi:hypothetical protein
MNNGVLDNIEEPPGKFPLTFWGYISTSIPIVVLWTNLHTKGRKQGKTRKQDGEELAS